MGVYISEINMPKSEGSKLVLQIFPNGEVCDGHGIRLGITNWAEAVPAADVAPVKHGKWIDIKDPVYCIECSECGDANYMHSNYCPNCGADMRGEQYV